MSIYDKLGAKTASIKARQIEKPADRTSKSSPGMFMAATQRMDAAEQRAEELEAQLEVALKQNSQGELPLSDLVEVKGRKRQLSGEEYSNLVDNLRNNALVTPITVRPVKDGRFEIISGHNRVAAFKDLKKPSIPAVIINAEEAQAEVNAFYANLFQPNLPDYEKYLGFKLMQNRKPGLSHEGMAELAGISRSQITRLMAFAELPEQVHQVLEQNVRALGANAAQDLGTLVKQGRTESVLEAVEKVAAGELDQKQAIRFASMKSDKPKSSRPEPKVIKNGKALYCSVRLSEKTLRLDFKSTEDAENVQNEIIELLKTRLTKQKNAS